MVSVKGAGDRPRRCHRDVRGLGDFTESAREEPRPEQSPRGRVESCGAPIVPAAARRLVGKRDVDRASIDHGIEHAHETVGQCGDVANPLLYPGRCIDGIDVPPNAADVHRGAVRREPFEGPLVWIFEPGRERPTNRPCGGIDSKYVDVPDDEQAGGERSSISLKKGRAVE
jgi:hypothetical protein